MTLRWYFAKPGATWFPTWHAFTPSSQDLDRRNPLTDPTNVGERTYQRRKKDWNHGRRPDGADGAEWHGQLNDFRLEFSADRERIVRNPRSEDVPACRLARLNAGTLLIEGDSLTRTAKVFRPDGDIRIEGESTITIDVAPAIHIEGESTLHLVYHPSGEVRIEGESTITTSVGGPSLRIEGESTLHLVFHPSGEVRIEGDTHEAIEVHPVGDLIIEGESTMTMRLTPGIGDLRIEGESLITIRFITGGFVEFEGGTA